MARNITITQGFSINEHVMSILSFNDEALLKLMLTGIAEGTPGAKVARLAVQDSDLAGFDLRIEGSNLAYDAAGHLISGIVRKITVLGPDGAQVGSVASTSPGGLNIDVAALSPIISNVSALATMFADWKFAFSGDTVPSGSTLLTYGVFFEGGLLADSIIGSNFNDYLGGGHAADTIRGGAGNDQIDGDDTIYLLGDVVPGADKLFGEDGNDLIRGRGGNDEMYGGIGNDTLTGDQLGETGNDTMFGGDGDDVLWGGEGNDTLNGGAGFDRIAQPINRSGNITYVVNLAKGTMTGEGTDKLISIEAVTGATYQHNNLTGTNGFNILTGGLYEDTLNGGGGGDKLNGKEGDDTINGGDGNDTVTGATGNDLLRGNAGGDLFIFAEAGADNADRVGDFGGADQIGLYQALIGWLPVGALSASAFKVIGSAAIDSDDRVLFDASSGELFVDMDGSGAAERQLVATLTNGASLSASDFVVLDYFGIQVG